MSKKYYVVLNMVQAIPEAVKLEFNHKSVTSWAKGMVGVLPVFTDKKKAREYAGKGTPIVIYNLLEEKNV